MNGHERQPSAVPASSISEALSGITAAAEESADFGEDDVRATYRYLARTDLGVLELRVIIPGSRDVLGIGFFDNEDAFVRACREMNGQANIYAGIQPRPHRFLDLARNRLLPLGATVKDCDIEYVTAVVIDLDAVRPDGLKKEAATDAELDVVHVRAEEVADWFVEHGFVRPVRNMSGNGDQIWAAVPPLRFLPDQREQVTEGLREFERQIRERFGGRGVKIDSIYNFSRVIKVIGTRSVKGTNTPERPHRTSLPFDPFVRNEDPKLLQHILSLTPGTSPKSSGETHQTQEPSIGQELPPRALAMLQTDTRLRALFEGHGKPEMGSDGKRLDTTSSGYDFSIVMAFARRGITDPGELASILWCRPDRAAREKGSRYILHTVREALAFVEQAVQAAQESAQGTIDFQVGNIVVRGSDPAIYHVEIDGRAVVLTADELLSPGKFKRRCVQALHRVPRLPRLEAWETLVNSWLAKADIVQLPPDATERGMHLEQIIAAIRGMNDGETADDLDRGRTVPADGRRWFKATPLLRRLHDFDLSYLRPNELGDLLLELGCVPGRPYIAGQRIRVWAIPARWPEGDEVNHTTDRDTSESPCPRDEE
jgi:hypothetical protein